MVIRNCTEPPLLLEFSGVDLQGRSSSRLASVPFKSCMASNSWVSASLRVAVWPDEGREIVTSGRPETRPPPNVFELSKYVLYRGALVGRVDVGEVLEVALALVLSFKSCVRGKKPGA